MSAIPSSDEYVTRHKEAFRCAFDFLNAHFPPGEDDDWWEQAAKDVAEASQSQGNNRLAMELLMGVYDYLDSEYKIRRDGHESTDH